MAVRRVFGKVILGAILLSLGGCIGNVPREALTLSPESLQRRQLQTRRYDTADEASLLSAVAGLVQDLGFTIDAAQSPLGLVVASKERDATESAQVTASVFAALFGVNAPPEQTQLIRVCVVTRPSATSTSVRVTFQRTIRDSQGHITRLEFVDDPEIYERFYAKLSKAVFLEAHSI